MKIECDKCGAKYSIADDKVRGKTFKIRCKKCSNVIIVRDKAGGGDATESEAPADEPGWHLAIGGETVGPLTESEVRDRFAAGEIDRETSVWQEGFEDWLPLADVGTFSDLTAGGDAGGAAPDPFAGAGEDDYSSPSGGGYSEPEPARSPEPARAAAVAAVTPTASASASKGDSPRVSQLTSTRNENSVLFSLDSLSSMAMGSGKPAGGGGGGGGGGASSPSPSSFTPIGGGGGGGASSPSAQGNSEGSGLIDIRSMGAMLGGGGGGGGGGAEDDRDDSMLPSFGGTGFGGLAAAPLLTTTTPTTPVSEPVAPEPQRSQAPLYAIIVLLVLGLGGVVFYVATRPPPAPERIVERVIQAAPVPVEKDDKGKDDRKKDDKDAKEEEGDEGAAEAEAGDVAADSGDKKGTTAKKTTDKKGVVTKTDAKKTDAKTDTKTEEPKKVESKPKEEDISVECLLDPSKCKKGGSSGGSGGSKPPPDSSGLPEKLELADIKAGTDGTKAAAKSNCSSKAKGGEKVKIKLSISGPSGTVQSSTPEEDGGNAALASCVASELKKSTFKKVQKEVIGTVVSVSF